METKDARTVRQRAVRLDALPHLASPSGEAQSDGTVSKKARTPFWFLVDEASPVMRLIDDHFLLLCRIVDRTGPTTLENERDTAEFARKIDEREKRLNAAFESSKEDKMVDILRYLLTCLNGRELMRQYWASPLDRAMDPKRGIVSSIEWKNWIRQLDSISSSLVDSVDMDLKMIEGNNLAGFISKVEFLDDLLDDEFANPERKLGERKVHVGNAINQKIFKKLGVNPGFVERRSIIAEPHMTEGFHTMRAIFLFTTLVAIIPGYLAWVSAPHLRGTTNDADFWSLLQGSIIQIQSILVIVVSIWTREDLSFKGWFWTWVFLALSCFCPVAAVPLYVYVPTEWSTAVSFLGAVAQGFMVLQSSFTKTKAKEKVN